MAKVKQWVDADTIIYTETKSVETVETISLSQLKADLAKAEQQYQDTLQIASNLQNKITDLTGQISTLELDTDRPAE